MFQAAGGGHARALRRVFEALGENWVKLGQSLALRFDVLPADLCRELLRIQNNIKPFGYPEVRRIIEQDLGGAPADLFQVFDEIPFAMTSSGQLHKATTPTGQYCVVKVQKEEAIEEFEVQSAVMRMLATVFDFVAAFETKAFSRIVDDFLQQRASELSLSVAATNARKMAALAEGDDLETNVRILGSYTRQRVMSWEFIDGISVVSIVNATKPSEPAHTNDPPPPDDVEQIARKIYLNALNQIFRDGIFHADISAAGLLVLPTGSIAYVDFAVIGRLDEERQKSLQRHYESLLEGRVDESVARLIECAVPPSAFDHAEFRRALAIILEDRLGGFQSPAGSLPRKFSQITYLSLLAAFREYGIPLPDELSVYFRTMVTIESLVFELCPWFDAVTEQSRFFSLAAREDCKESRDLPRVIEQMARLYQDGVELVSDLRRLHNSAQAIEISLRTLRIRLIQYAFWAVGVAACAYFGFRDEALLRAAGFKPLLYMGVVLLVALFLANRVWRQSRQLSRVDGAIVSTGEVSRRSFGRVR